ncbi:hypothetical protein BKA62DRAFT_373271 [Auriculariales sp. MPI-PUGE-AT-0066]|nr:hypothetical protein BKA62DRAFT_373271 [Auriculariales sp. MPI-PUGE-AT-0066]
MATRRWARLTRRVASAARALGQASSKAFMSSDVGCGRPNIYRAKDEYTNMAVRIPEGTCGDVPLQCDLVRALAETVTMGPLEQPARTDLCRPQGVVSQWPNNDTEILLTCLRTGWPTETLARRYHPETQMGGFRLVERRARELGRLAVC